MKNLPSRKKGRLIIVAYRLPFKIIRDDVDQVSLFQNSGGLVSAVLSLAQGQENTSFEFEDKIQWVGYTDNSKEELEGVPLENENFKAHPVFISPELNDKYYGAFVMTWYGHCFTTSLHSPNLTTVLLRPTRRPICFSMMR